MKVGDHEIHVEGRLVRLARLAADGYEFLDDPTRALDGLRSCGMRIDLFTFVPELPDTRRSVEERHGAAGALRALGGWGDHIGAPHVVVIEWDNVAAVPVSTFDHWWRRQVKDTVRNKLRRAERSGVTVREVPFDDALVHGISALYNESPVRQGRPFRHYGKSLDRVRRENATFLDRSVFLGAFLGNDLIGFAKLVAARHQAALMQIVSMIGHRDKAPTNALIAHAVRTCAERHVPYLVYARFSYGGKRRDPLRDFKRHNGFQRLEVPRYYVPLTGLGRAALRLGLHRRLSAYVPDAVLAGLRSARRLWYARRMQLTRQVR